MQQRKLQEYEESLKRLYQSPAYISLVRGWKRAGSSPVAVLQASSTSHHKYYLIQLSNGRKLWERDNECQGITLAHTQTFPNSYSRI